ncbi:zinc finger protein, partial [Loa loa]
EQSHKRPHDGCDASFDNRDEYRKRKKTPDQPFICKRKRPDCGPTSSFPSRNETRQPKFQCENCKEFFCRKDYLKIHMKRCLITSR